MQESSELLYNMAKYNPFTQAVELIRFALYGQYNENALIYTAASLVIFLLLAIWGYNPSKGLMPRKRG
jgi:ABC-2 type transport system permease protein